MAGLATQKWIHSFATVILRFEMYNRKVLLGQPNRDLQQLWYTTNEKIYRWSYILLGAALTGVFMNQFELVLNTKLGVEHLVWRAYAISFSQIIWQFGFLTLIRPSKRLVYLGNMTTVSLMGSLLLIPLFVLNSVFNLPLVFLLTGFGLVVSMMLIVHIKRCKTLELPFLTSVSWITFRLIVLFIVLTNLYGL